MPEESESSELDLSNLDSLLKDMEKDLAPDSADEALEITDDEPAERLTVPMAQPAVEAAAVTTTAAVAVADEDPMPPHDEVLASPVRPNEKDEPPDQNEDMFTDEEEPPERILQGADTAEGSPEPAAPPEPPAAVSTDISFEDALDVLAEETPPVVPEAPMSMPEPQLPNPTPELFASALKDKKYDQAVRIGKSLLANDSTPSFRMNLAGAMFYAGLRDEAERELASLLKQFPYHISARRNIEFVRAGE